MKIGDYVRTKEFGISRVKWFDNNEPILENGFTALQKEYKSSPDIIDLIEAGDYVDRLRVVDKEENYIVVETFDERIVITKEDTINSVVTKEQFESMEYKLGGRNVKD